MFQQDFQPQQYEYHTAGEFGFCFIAGAEYVPDLYPDRGERERGHTDKRDCECELNVQKGKGNAHRKRVDAGRHREQEHGPDIKGIALCLAVV